MNRHSLGFKINLSIMLLFLLGLTLALVALNVFNKAKNGTYSMSETTIPITLSTIEIMNNYQQVRYYTKLYMLDEQQETYDAAVAHYDKTVLTVAQLQELIKGLDISSVSQVTTDVDQLVQLLADYKVMIDDEKNKIARLSAAVDKMYDINQKFLAVISNFSEFSANKIALMDPRDHSYRENLQNETIALNLGREIAILSTNLYSNANLARWSLNPKPTQNNQHDLQEISDRLEALDLLLDNEETKSALYTLNTHYMEFSTGIANLINQLTSIIKQDTERDNLGKRITSISEKIGGQATGGAISGAKSLHTLINGANGTVIAVIIAFVLIGAGVIIYINRSISKKLSHFVDLVSEFTNGDGDLTRRVPVTSKDEIGLLASNFNCFVDNVHQIIVEVKNAADDVASGNNQLAATMEQLSATFSMQSEQIASVAGNMSTMSESTNIMVTNLSQNIGVMNTATNSVHIGSEQLKTVVSSMDTIKNKTAQLSNTINNLNQSSTKIGEILGVINDIADQTNLLALNAAIEAARAGDAGRGFAVVADEVRKLAERTQKSTGEISEIITGLQKDSDSASKEMQGASLSVDAGLDSILSTDKQFNTVVSSVTEISNTTVNVNNNINNQFNMIQEINDNAQSIASGIEESAQVVSEVTTTVSHLQERADILKSVVSKFKV